MDKCPVCNKELWKSKQKSIDLTTNNDKDGCYQVIATVYWCANEDSMDGGCGFSKVEFED